MQKKTIITSKRAIITTAIKIKAIRIKKAVCFLLEERRGRRKNLRFRFVLLLQGEN